MTNPSIEFDRAALGERFLRPSAISLPSDAIAWAAALSQTATTADADAWPLYLQLLAVLGVEDWLQERAPQWPVQWQLGSSAWQPLPSDGSLPALSATPDLAQPAPLLRIHNATVQLLTLSCLEDGWVSVPAAAMNPDTALNSSDPASNIPLDIRAADLADKTPQYHLLVEVLEEIEQVQIQGFLPHTELVQAIQTQALSIDGDQAYTVPTAWFDLEPDRFLLQVACLSPTPVTASVPDPVAASGSAVDLSSALFGLNLDVNPDQVAEVFRRAATNVATWFNDRLDQVAQDLAWQLLPAFSYSPALRSLRSPIEQLDGIVSDLTRYQSVVIPTESRSISYDFELGGAALRIYILVWELPTAGDQSDWMLLAILSPQPHALLPLGMSLQIRDVQTLLAETTVQSPSDTFLYTQVVGVQHERFLITVRSPDALFLSLPPVIFSPS